MGNAFGPVRRGDLVQFTVVATVKDIKRRKGEAVHVETGDNWFYASQPSLAGVQILRRALPPEGSVVKFHADENLTYTVIDGKFIANDGSGREPYNDSQQALNVLSGPSGISSFDVLFDPTKDGGVTD